MTTEDFKRKLTAILSTDVVGYKRMMETDETFTYSKPETLFEKTSFICFQDDTKGIIHISGDIHHDERRFFMVKPVQTKDDKTPNEVTPKISIVLNWFEEI